MQVVWGTKKWQIGTAICIIFIFGYGTYTVLLDIIVGHPIWWYNLSLPLFALTILGLLLLVRQGWETLRNILAHGFRPSSKVSYNEESIEGLRNPIDYNYEEDKYLPEDSE